MSQFLSVKVIVQQVKLCLEVVWERPPYFTGRGINVKDNKFTIYKMMKLYDGREDI